MLTVAFFLLKSSRLNLNTVDFVLKINKGTSRDNDSYNARNVKPPHASNRRRSSRFERPYRSDHEKSLYSRTVWIQQISHMHLLPTAVFLKTILLTMTWILKRFVSLGTRKSNGRGSEHLDILVFVLVALTKTLSETLYSWSTLRDGLSLSGYLPQRTRRNGTTS